MMWVCCGNAPDGCRYHAVPADALPHAFVPKVKQPFLSPRSDCLLLDMCETQNQRHKSSWCRGETRFAHNARDAGQHFCCIHSFIVTRDGTIWYNLVSKRPAQQAARSGLLVSHRIWLAHILGCLFLVSRQHVVCDRQHRAFVEIYLSRYLLPTHSHAFASILQTQQIVPWGMHFSKYTPCFTATDHVNVQTLTSGVCRHLHGWHL